jgi:hypothetical protein
VSVFTRIQKKNDKTDFVLEGLEEHVNPSQRLTTRARRIMEINLRIFKNEIAVRATQAMGM